MMNAAPRPTDPNRRAGSQALNARYLAAQAAAITAIRVGAKIPKIALSTKGREPIRVTTSRGNDRGDDEIAADRSSVAGIDVSDGVDEIDDLLMTDLVNETLAYWVTGPGRSELRKETLPPLRAGQLRIRALYSGVSRGTESLVFNGQVPPTEYARMRAPFQAGDFPAPVKYGYASVGVVEDGPVDRVGKVVFCLHPHQAHYHINPSAVHSVPEAVPPSRAVLAANLETAVNAVWDSELGPGDRVSVIGAGSVGCLVAWLAARIPGCEVELVDINPARGTIADTLGVRFSTPARARAEADVVLNASGSSDGLARALELAGFESTIVELSWYGDRSVEVPLGGSFHSRRLTLKSSQVGSVSPARRARWTHDRRLQLALSLLAAPELDVLINSEGRFADLPMSMAELAREEGHVIMHRVVYD